MSNAAADVVEAYFKQSGFTPARVGDDGEAMRFRFSAKNKDYDTLIVFDDDSEGCSLEILDIVHNVTDDKKVKVLETLNRLNTSYRWVKFCLSEDGEVFAKDDAVIDLDTCGEEVDRCIQQLGGIVDLAYPEIMKALYA